MAYSDFDLRTARERLGVRLCEDVDLFGKAGQIAPVFGAVTTGNNWRFVKLDGDAAFIDRREYYYLDHLDKILGILVAMSA